MNKKNYTLFLVSNQAGEAKKIVIPATWLRAGGVLAILFATVFAAGVLDYFGLLVQTVENKRLRAENAQLSKEFQIVESKLNSLENSLERVKTFSAKLKLITNIDAQDRALKLAIGPLPKVGQSVEEADQKPPDRAPSAVVAREDEPFLEKNPVDESAGELSVEGQRDYASLAIRIDKAVHETRLKEQSVLDLWESLSERQSLLNATPSIRPVKGWFTSRFGYRISPFTGRPVMHNGLDIAASPGSPVFAPADGVVSFAGYDEGYGKLVSIDHGYGVVTRFGHNSQIYVQPGQRISRWDVISAVGSTGRSTGPHLHYEVRLNNVPVDPANYVLDE